MTARAISVAEASQQILASIERMPVESVPLSSALGAVLAETVVARVSIPPWRGSSMDGYAVRASDINTVPCSLRVTGESAAGATSASHISAGEAFRIMTGAPVPVGADTVVRIEDTDRGTVTVEIRDARDAGRNVRPLGEDFRAGDVLLADGERIGPAAIGVLASAGISTVATYRQPAVSIVSSGDELVRVDGFDSVLSGERIVSSNSYSLPAMIRDAGGRPRDGGITRDDPIALRRAIEGAMACDLLITSGGVSVGDRDFTRTVMHDMGADIKFWRARIRPGGPIVFAIVDGRPWIGLPGNPVSALVTFELFVRPAILKMLGETLLFPTPQTVTLDERVTTSGDLMHFLRAVVSQRDGELHARLTGTQSSAALTSMVRANALLIVPEGQHECLPGDKLRAVPLGQIALSLGDVRDMKRQPRGAELVALLEKRFVTVNDDVRVGNRDVNILRPRSAEDLISETDFDRDERLPYWAELWPSSTILANFIIADARPKGRAVELGAGVGLVSIAATMAGYDVTATDYYEDALAFARANAFRNLGREIETALIDWRDVSPAIPRFDVVLASDVLYESRYAPLVAGVVDRLLSERGVAYIADPGRVAANAFADACVELGLSVSTGATRPYQAGVIRQTITVYEVVRA